MRTANNDMKKEHTLLICLNFIIRISEKMVVLSNFVSRVQKYYEFLSLGLTCLSSLMRSSSSYGSL